MKTKLLFKDSGRRSYAPPVAEALSLCTERIVCASEEVDAVFNLGAMTENDLTGLF